MLDEPSTEIGRYVGGYDHRPHPRLANRTPRDLAATWRDHEDKPPGGLE